MAAARKLTTTLRAAREGALTRQEAGLRRGYEHEVRRFGREAAAEFERLVSLTAAATWSPPSTAEVTRIAVKASRIQRAQQALLRAVGGMLEEAMGELGVSFSMTHPIVQGLLDKMGMRVETTIAQGVREPVTGAIARAWAQGASVPDTAKAIREAVAGVAEWQATMLARTDLISLSNGAGSWAAQQVNSASQENGEGTVIATRTWLSSQDDRVRETHEEADGTTVGIDEMYQVGSAELAYPGDPDGPDEEVINCRCTELFDESVATGDAPGEELLAGGWNWYRTQGPLNVRGLGEGTKVMAELARGGVLGLTAVPFQHDLEEASMSALADETTDVTEDVELQAWMSDIAFEGLATGDGRFMVEGSLRWRDPPLTLMAMVETPDFGGHAGAQVAGRMDDFSKRPTDMDGGKLAKGITAVFSTGVFDRGEHGSDVERMVSDEMLTGISVDLAIHEWAFRDPDTGEIINPDDASDDDWERAFMGELDFAILDAEIMAATVCPTPAFADARIALLAAGVLRPKVWRAAHEYAAANGLPDGQLMTTLVASCKPTGDALVASSTLGLAPVAPPLAFFTRPEPKVPTPLTLTDDGEIYGHLCLWETCHTGFINGEWSQCIRPPRSKTGYSRFHVGEIVTSEGHHVEIGNLTIGTGHAPMNASPKQTRDHYDNSGSIAAFVRALDGELGVWVSGATRSDMTPEQLRDLRACPPSGDWRSVNHNLELHAALAVPVPGFPVERSQIALAASADGGIEITALILTASSEPGEEFMIDMSDEPASITLPADVLAAIIEGGGEALDDLIAA